MNGLVAFGIIVLVTVGVLYTVRNTPNCTGNCEQGRKPCDCNRGKWEK